MAKGGGGQTIVVAGGSGGGGTKDGGGSNGNGGGRQPKDPLSGGKLNVDDQLFWAVMIGAGALAAVAHLYTSNPSLFHDFLKPFQKLGQPAPAAPAQPAQPSQQITAPQTSFENPMGQDPSMGGIQYPQQGMASPPQNFGSPYGQTQYNPTFGQNANIMPEQYPMQQSFYTIDSGDGMIRDY